MPIIIPVMLIIGLVAWVVVSPLFGDIYSLETSTDRDTQLAWLLRARADLLQRRRELYQAMRDLDFDYKTDKVAEADYARQRYALVSEAVEVLQGIDSLQEPDHDPVEHALYSSLSAQTEGNQASFCPQCGEAVAIGDRFCGACGTAL